VFLPKGDKAGDTDSFCVELEHIFDKFPKYHIKILLGDFNAKVDRGNIFKPKSESDTESEYSYFTTGGLLPISSSWRQAPWDS
jgi:hypothetical protein